MSIFNKEYQEVFTPQDGDILSINTELGVDLSEQMDAAIIKVLCESSGHVQITHQTSTQCLK